ncbi:MAG: repeat protein [Pedosphaera sp.]|nr:repeat protein [Pedosphaera sp.]
MGKHRRIWLAASALTLMCGIGWLLLNSLESEPVYQGKQLGAWLETYLVPRPKHEQAWQQADGAVRQIGTNAIPTLLTMLRHSDSAPWKRRFLDLAYKQHLIKFNHTIAWRQNWCAANAFGALGADASVAVPALIKLYENPVSSPSQRYTAMALRNIGPAAKLAIPSLLRAANTSTEEEVKTAAVFALGGIHSEPELVVPVLKRCMGDTSVEVQKAAIDGLGNFSEEAKSSVPALIELLQNPNQEITKHARTALLRIDSEAATKAGIR